MSSLKNHIANNWLERMSRHWVYGGFLCSFILLAVIAIISSELPTLFLLICGHLPAYMWHQYEEHDDCRFQRFCDTHFGKGTLDQTAIFVINVFGVWGLFSGLIIAGHIRSVGYGLGIVYLTLVNGLSHFGQAIKLQTYNPGLFTGVLVFIPLSGTTLYIATGDSDVAWYHHLTGAAIGAGVHLLILLYIRMRWLVLHQQRDSSNDE